MKLLSVSVFLALYVSAVWADCYMHNPRGSNDRLNEANTNRNNANRLFDSQNNAKGGYCYGPAMSYYEGSLLSVEWTAQHGCGNEKLWCNMVLQYMCSDLNTATDMTLVRDGTTTDTIPDNEDGPTTKDANGDLQFGMHESYEFYQNCKTRTRNMGLWIADRESEGGLNAGRRSSIFTRQNNNGNRHGYECAEERDYYPYWAPTEWKDIAILTEKEEYCEFYQKESQNVAPKGYCRSKTPPNDVMEPWNPTDCQIAQGEWVEKEAWGIPAPECIKADFSRDNHLGNGVAGAALSYNWTLPDIAQEKCIETNKCNCVLRLRYNISTADVNKPTADLTIDGNNPAGTGIDWKYNAGASPIFDDVIFPDKKGASGYDLQMAMDNTQFGRTFQDRSHVFHIKPRSDGDIPAGARIFNLNVRGKRGNIVQAYPAVEYDFVPEQLYVRVGDYIHFQWTGCDTNPAGNAGEGTDQTDRSNMVQIENYGANLPASEEWIAKNTPLFETPELRKRMALLDQTGCKSQEELLAENNNNENDAKEDTENCMKLNAASQYFDGGCIRMNLTTTEETPFYYMSSRNNNFSNRGQKGAIWVLNLLPNWAIGVVVAGGMLFAASGGIAGAAFYAKSHPHSRIANIFSKF